MKFKLVTSLFTEYISIMSFSMKSSLIFVIKPDACQAFSVILKLLLPDVHPQGY